jgi:RHS repeat-associated protein
LPDGQQWHYAWDGAGQLSKVTRPDGYAVTFAYDALGRRVSKRFRGRVTRWVWDGDQPLHEWAELEVGPGAGSAGEVLTWLFEEESFAPLAKLTTQGAYSVVCDHLGTPLSLHDAQGVTTWELQLDSYGNVRQGRGRAQDCPFRYQGQYEDVETGLYYNRFRYFDPETGQYISQDPIGLLGIINEYIYVHDPLSWVDVLGLQPVHPKTVRFSQNDAGKYFGDGRSVNELTARLKANPEHINEVEPIRKVRMGQLPPEVQARLRAQGASESSVFSLDNRRLYAAKEAGLKKNPSRWATPKELAEINLDRRFSTENAGQSMSIRC